MQVASLRIAGIAALLLSVAALLWMLWNLAQVVMGSEQSQTAPSGNPGIASAGAQNSPTQLAQLPLFGRRQQALAIPVVSGQTKLDLILRGTIPGTEPERGMAIVEAEGRQRTYRVGDAIGSSDEVKLHEVHADHVVLARLGRYETLALSRPEPGTSATDPAAGQATLPGALPRANAGARGLAGAPIDTAALARSIQAMPHFENGQQRGFRIQVGPQHAELVRKLGLRGTDVITAINGVEMNNPAQAMELARQLKRNQQVEVQLRRDGAIKTLTIDTGQLFN